jgi:phosphatidylinositol glycan class N
VNCRCAFSAITRLLELPRLGCYFVVILLSDVMTIHFFFLVSVCNPEMHLALLGTVGMLNLYGVLVGLFQSSVNTRIP